MASGQGPAPAPQQGFPSSNVQWAAPQGQGPTLADEKKRLAEAKIQEEQAPAKIKHVEQKNSDGTVTETISNAGSKRVIKRDAQGRVLSTTTTTDDAVGDPLAGPTDNYGVDAFDPNIPLTEQDFEQGSMVLSPQGQYIPEAEVEDQYQGAMPEVVEPLSLRERLTPGPRPMNPINQIIMLPGGDDLDQLREGEGLPIAPDFGPLILGEEEPLNEPDQAPSLQDRIANYNQPPTPLQGAAQFQAPRRTWANMDWTGVKRATDAIYGTKIAEGSVDPYVAEYKRAVTAFKLNNPSVGKDGKGTGTLAWAKFHASRKDKKAKIQLAADLKIEKDIIAEDKIKEATRRSDREFILDEKKYQSVHDFRAKAKAKKGSGYQYEAGTPGGDIERTKHKLLNAQLANLTKTIEKKAEGTPAQNKQKNLATALSLSARHAGLALVAGKAAKGSDYFDPTSWNPKNLRQTPNSKWKSPHAKRYWKASYAWTSERTRYVSGAAIKDSEMPQELKKYWAEPGDTPQITLDKLELRRNQELNYWTSGWGSNFAGAPDENGIMRVNPNAARNSQDVAARMAQFDERSRAERTRLEAEIAGESSGSGGKPKATGNTKIDARLGQLKNNVGDRAKSAAERAKNAAARANRKAARKKRMHELLGGDK